MDDLVARVLAEKARCGLSLYKLAQQTGMADATLRDIARTGLTRSLHARRRLRLWLEGQAPAATTPGETSADLLSGR